MTRVKNHVSQMKTVCNLLKECLEHFSNTGIVPAELLLLSFLFDHEKTKQKKFGIISHFLIETHCGN